MKLTVGCFGASGFGGGGIGAIEDAGRMGEATALVAPLG
jgi:hypothetical protein